MGLNDRDKGNLARTMATAPLISGGTMAAALDNAEVIDTKIADLTKEQEAFLSAIKSTTYGTVDCNASDGQVSERFGRKSCAAIEALVTVPALGIRLPVTIWGRLVVSATGSEITFEASAPKGMKFLGDGKEMLLAHAENAAFAWNGYDKATAAAEARLMGQTAKITGANGAVISRPKLVKRVITQTANPAA